ncbi:MAG: cobalamin biosynthesis protein [Spirochaetes bacterium]|nr:cobalamin biosynthesis protein [Spirochaetota bacterium]
MVGYKNDKYLLFGRVSAKIDDAANYLPARLAYIIIPLAAFFAGFSFQKAYQIALRDGNKNPSPNSGISEAAFAGALGIQLGGVNYYHGKKVVKPLIGDPLYPLNEGQIIRANQLLYQSAILTIIVFTLLYSLFDIFF